MKDLGMENSIALWLIINSLVWWASLNVDSPSFVAPMAVARK
jgi:hypothetical protein